MADYYGTQGDDTISGTDGDDFVNGLSGNDVLSGLGGNDNLQGSEGADVVNGGAGDDLIRIDFDSAVDTLTGGAGADRFLLSIYGQSTTLLATDRITDFSVAEGDRLDFNMHDGGLRWAGAVTTPGFSLTAGQSFGAGVAGFADVWTWTNGGSTWLIIDTNNNETLDNSDLMLVFDGTPALGPDAFAPGGFTAQFGTAGNDAFTGAAVADLYYALAGDDAASGAGGDDEINGGAGADTLDGGDGNDLLIGETGSDILHGGVGDDQLYAGMRYTSSQSDVGTTNELYGEDGDDVLVAGEGQDLLVGGAGADFLGSRDDDTASGGDILLGGDGDDIINFNGDLLVDGGAGNDLFYFGLVASTVTGGTGADHFDLSQGRYDGNFGAGQIHLITDFSQAEGDQLDFGLRSSSQPPLIFRGVLDNPAFSLQAGQSFSSAGYGSDLVQIWTWASGGETFVIADFDGSGTLTDADYVLRLAGAIALTQDGFTPGTLNTNPGGTAGADVIQGTDSYDVIYGLSGDDIIHAGAGNDYIYGNAGDDEIYGGADSNYLYGGDGDDVLTGGSGYNVLHGGGGSDVIHGGAGGGQLNAGGHNLGDVDTADDVNLIYGSDFADFITGGRGPLDQSFGNGGDDIISGGGLVDGGDGADQLNSAGALAATLLDGGAGDDTINSGAFGDLIIGGAGSDKLSGGGGDDEIVGAFGDRWMYGDDGDDILRVSGQSVPGSQALTLSGGAGTDLVDFSGATAFLTVDLSNPYEQNTGGGGVVYLTGIENAIAAAAGSRLTGTAGDNRLEGRAGADRLFGGDGSDVLTGAAGDHLYGENGDDTLVFTGSAAVTGSLIVGGAGVDTAVLRGASTSINLATGTGTVESTAVTFSGVENVTVEGVGSGLRSVSGNGGDNRFEVGALGNDGSFDVHFQGLSGNDTLRGGAGSDTLDGGVGDDVLRGGAGTDLLIGGSGLDAADYTAAAGGVAASLTLGGASDDGDGGADSFSGIETLLGSAFNDNLTGNGGNNGLSGGAGNDTLEGLNGDDLLIGGAGVDVLNGGGGNDTADYSGAAAGMRAQLNTGASSNDGDGGTDTLISIENLTGSAFNDILIGEAVANVLRGGLGSDTLIGLAGNDVLWGGAGALNALQGGTGDDLYVLEAADSVTEFAGEGADTVDARINTYVLANNVENLIFGGVGGFAGTGNAAANVITGGAGADVLRGRGGVDTLNGGGGMDTVDYTLAAAGAVIRLDLQKSTNDGDGATDVFSSIENAIGSNFNDVMYGDGGANLLQGGNGSDVLVGGGGDDILMGGSGGVNNQMQGGTGNDRYILDAFDTCVEFAGEGVDTVEARVGTYTLGNHIENLIYTGPGKFVGNGNAMDNILTGGDLNDILRGKGGNDTIYGGMGSDEVQLQGSKAQYTVTAEGIGWRVVDSVAGRDGSTYVESVEVLRFQTGNTTTVLIAAAPPADDQPQAKGDMDAFVMPPVPEDQPLVLPALEVFKGGDDPLVLPGADDGLRLFANLEARLAFMGEGPPSPGSDGHVLNRPVDYHHDWL